MKRQEYVPGPLMIGLEGPELTSPEREQLAHPAVGGIILFARNYEAPGQLDGLIAAIREIREDIPVAVDQEGGRVQRFRTGFTPLPAAAAFRTRFAPAEARQVALEVGWLAGSELAQRGIDLDFAPVLDLDQGFSTVIGDRAFHETPEGVAALAEAFARGLQAAGVGACGKHYPGHGGVAADSHEALPVDPRPERLLAEADLIPFARLAGGLEALMPAHVVFEAVDSKPAGFSPVWLRERLRGQLRYRGAIISDDLGMAGAEWAGGPVERAEAALDAGCDLALVADPDWVAPVLDQLHWKADQEAAARRRRLLGRPAVEPLDPERLARARQLASMCRQDDGG